MKTVSTIGLDIAKSVFQVHGVDANGVVVIRRQLKRRRPAPRRIIGRVNSRRWATQFA
jgi:transposase